MEGTDGKEAKKRKLEDSKTPEITEEIAEKLLGPLTKEQLVDILKPAIIKHFDVLDGVRKFLNKDVTLRKLFVRGLGFETTTESLAEVFAEHGGIEDAHVVFDKNTGKNKGYAFITYKHVDSALLALQEPSKKVDGRMTVSNLAAAGPQQQQQQNQLLQQLPVLQPIPPLQPIPALQPIQPANPFQPATTDPTLRKIYVGNVPYSMQASRLTDFFSQYGDIEEGPGGFDRATGKCKGYSLILYKTLEAANRALEDPVKSIDGHQLFCKLAEGQKQKGAANQGQAGPDLMDKGNVNTTSLNHVSQYGGLSHGLVNPALMNSTSLAAAGLNAYGLSDASLPSLSRDPVATGLPYNSLNSSAPMELGRQLLLQGRRSVAAGGDPVATSFSYNSLNSSAPMELGRQLLLQGRKSLGAGGYGISPYGSSGYGNHSYSSFGGAASHHGIPPSSSVAQTAAYEGASHYPLASHPSQLSGTSPSSGILPGMRSYYSSS